jgi:hypothetical protein
MDAVIKGAKQVDVWNAHTWEVPMALQLYESVIPLFKYPTTHNSWAPHPSECADELEDCVQFIY